MGTNKQETSNTKVPQLAKSTISRQHDQITSDQIVLFCLPLFANDYYIHTGRNCKLQSSPRRVFKGYQRKKRGGLRFCFIYPLTGSFRLQILQGNAGSDLVCWFSALARCASTIPFSSQVRSNHRFSFSL